MRDIATVVDNSWISHTGLNIDAELFGVGNLVALDNDLTLFARVIGIPATIVYFEVQSQSGRDLKIGVAEVIGDRVSDQVHE